jgi:endonuclease-3
VCKARKPDCPVCVIKELCRYTSKTPDSKTPDTGVTPKRGAANAGKRRKRANNAARGGA